MDEPSSQPRPVAVAHSRRPWGAQDHRGDPGATGHRKDPHALGSAGSGTALGASPWPGAARGLRPHNRDSSGDPATRAACVRVVAGPMEAARRQGITRRRHHGEAQFGWAINAQQLASRSQPVSKDRFKHVGRCVPPLFCRIRGAVGKKRARLKSLSPPAQCMRAAASPVVEKCDKCAQDRACGGVP